MIIISFVKPLRLDLWFGLWRLRTKLPETSRALGFEQQGHWEYAQQAYEEAMAAVQLKPGQYMIKVERLPFRY